LSEHRWYVAQLKAGRERVAIKGLGEQDFRTYYPQMMVTRARNGRIIDDTEPVFPTYLFVQSQHDAHRWRSIKYTRGVIRLLGNNQPCPMPDREVEALQDRERDGLLCHPRRRPIRPGDLVEFKCGPFTGLQGVCQWTRRERIGVLLQILGGDNVLTSSRDLLKLAVA